MQQTYIHYGHNEYDPNLFTEPKNRPYFCKPSGGLWASPVDAKLGWKEWNDDNGFRDCKEENSFRFQLSEQVKVYHIYCKDDVKQMPLVPVEYFHDLLPDFEDMKRRGYDAIQYHLSDQRPPENEMDGLYWVLYGWDCDCLLVLNKGVVIPIGS